MIPNASAPDRVDRRRAMAILAAATLAACAGGNVMSLPDDDAAPDEGIVDVGGVPVHYVRRGAGSPVVLIHGASGNLNDWRMGAMQALSERHDVIAFDRAGLGGSGWPGPQGVRLTEQARLMRVALARLGVERATVVGHSYGGSVALSWALEDPGSVRSLVLVSAPSEVWDGGLGLTTDLLANPLTGPIFAAAVPAFLPRSVAQDAAAAVFAPQTPPPGYLERLGYADILNARSLRRNALQLTGLKEQIRTMAPRYPSLSMPIELLHGTADDVVPARIHSQPFATEVATARLTMLQGVGHMPHHVALPDLLAAVRRIA
jgi:pimeloyl-ACP methyl ester carboxylesterase